MSTSDNAVGHGVKSNPEKKALPASKKVVGKTASGPSKGKKPAKKANLAEKLQKVLGKFKEFLTLENREKLVRLCEIEDLSKESSIPLIIFNRVLKYMGFRVLFEEVKCFVSELKINKRNEEKILYNKLSSAVLRKLYRPKPYLVLSKLTQLQAVVILQKFYRDKIEILSKSGSRNPKAILRELNKKIVESRKPLLKCFEDADRSKRNFLELSDLDALLRNFKIDVTFEELRTVFNLMDTNGINKVDYERFITAIESCTSVTIATLPRMIESKEVIKEVINILKNLFKSTLISCEIMFNLFDQDNKGILDFDDFYLVLAKIGMSYSQYEVRQIFNFIDTSKDGFISFAEFSTVFYNLNEDPVDILNRLELEERLRKEEEEKQRRLEEEKKKIEEEEKKKREEEEAKKKAEEPKGKKGAKAGAKTGKKESKGGAEEKKGAKKAGKEGKGKAGKKGGKKGAEEPKPPPEPDPKEIAAKELFEAIKADHVYPLISAAYVRAEAIMLALQGQKKFEERPVTKIVYANTEDWSHQILSPMLKTLWASGNLGRIGFLNDQGVLHQLHLLDGSEISLMHLGTKPPFENIPIIGGVCDSNLGRLYILNKQWILEVWDFHQNTSSAIKRVKVLSKIVGYDYVLRYEDTKDLLPNLLSVDSKGKIIVNSTCADGFVYCFEPISLTLLWRSRLTLDEIQISKPMLTIFDEFDKVVRECQKSGISEENLFRLLNPQSEGLITLEKFVNLVKENKVPIKEPFIKNIFKTLDSKNVGMINVQVLASRHYLRSQEFVKNHFEDKSQILLPEWVNNIHANETAKECMSKLYEIMALKNITQDQILSKLVAIDSDQVSLEVFSKTLKEALSPELADSDLKLVSQVADRDGTGKIHFYEFFANLTSKKLCPTSNSQLNSKGFPKNSLKYVLHKSVELGIDLYKLCKEKDKSASGTLPKETFFAVLLVLPIGLTKESLTTIFDRDITYNSVGHIDYLEIFERQEYYTLLINSKRTDFLTPPVQEESAVIFDFVLVGELNLIIFATSNPVSSVIYIKDLNGNLLAKLVGHFGNQPPKLCYIEQSNVLVSAERRKSIIKSDYEVALPPCEILLWNLQADLVLRHKFQPPWVLVPTRRVFAHESNIDDLKYLPISQVLVSCGRDECIKLWNVTGVPFTLAEQENLPIGGAKPGDYVLLSSQYTTSNQLLASAGTIHTKLCLEIQVTHFESVEWLTGIFYDNNEFSIGVWGFSKFFLKVPAKMHDWDVPEFVHAQIREVMGRYRKQALETYSEGIATRIEEIKQNQQQVIDYENSVKKIVVKAILHEDFYSELFEKIKNIPGKKGEGSLGFEEFYNILVKYAGFHTIPYQLFIFILNDIEENYFHRKIANKSEAELVSFIRSLEEIIENQKKAEGDDEEKVQDSENIEEVVESKEFKETVSRIFACLSKRLQEKSLSANDMLSKIDTNQDKLLNCDELILFLRKLDFNLRKSEASSIMKCIDFNNSTVLKIPDFREKLKSVGYADPYFTNFYEYIWQDQIVFKFLQKFKKAHKFRDFSEFFSYFDKNYDSILKPQELLNAFQCITKKHAERLLNITLGTLQKDLSCARLSQLFVSLEKTLQIVQKITPNAAAMEVCIKNFNSLIEINRFTLELEKHCLNLMLGTKIGLEIHASKYRLSESLGIISVTLLAFQELVDYLISNALVAFNKNLSIKVVEQQPNLTKNEFLDSKVPEISKDEAQIMWDSDSDIRNGEGVLNESVNAYVLSYSPSLLDKEYNGEKHFDLLKKELLANVHLQEKSDHIVKCIGYFEEEIYSQKSITVLYENVEGTSVKSLTESSGGILTIPIINRVKGAAVLFSYWGQQILSILQSFHSIDLVPFKFTSENLFLNQDCSTFVYRMQGLGILEGNNIVKSADFKTYFEDFTTNPFIAPEYFTKEEQTKAVSSWNFGMIMFLLLFGESPLSFLEAYQNWCEKKKCESQLIGKNTEPAKSFYYLPVSAYLIQNGVARKSKREEIRTLRSLGAKSFSGLVQEFDSGLSKKKEISQIIQKLKNEDSGLGQNSEISEILSIISMCLQLDPLKRPDVNDLLGHPLFTLNEIQTEQAKAFAKIIFKHKNPDLVISSQISLVLDDAKYNFSVTKAEEVLEKVKSLKNLLISEDESTVKDTTEAVEISNLSEKEKKGIIERNLASESTEIINKCVSDGVFKSLIRLSLMFLSRGDHRIIDSFSDLLMSLFEFFSSLKSFSIQHLNIVLEAFLQIFIGEPENLASASLDNSYMQRPSYWSPDLFDILSAKFKEIINEKYSAVNVLVGKTRHKDYFSELFVLSENLTIIKRQDSNIFQKINSLRNIKNAIISNNEHRIKAVLDLRVPFFIINVVNDEDCKVRAEALEIFYEISKGLPENLIPSLPDLDPDSEKSDLLLNYFSVTSNVSKELTINKTLSGDKYILKELKILSCCFYSTIFVIPVVRTIKLKSETSDNKEIAIKILMNCLTGTEKAQQACMNPITDTLSTLCFSLVSSARSADSASGNSLAITTKDLLEKWLSATSPHMLKSFRLAPGSEILFKEQNLKIGEVPTLALINELVPEEALFEDNCWAIANLLKNYLNGVYRKDADKNLVLHVVHKCIGYFQSLCNLLWNLIENSDKNLNSEQRKAAKTKLKDLFKLFEWLVYYQYDFGWFLNIDNIEWIVEKSTKAFETVGNDYDAFPLEDEGIICQKILCRLIRNTEAVSVLEKLMIGKVFSAQCKAQTAKLKEMMMKNPSPLQVLEKNYTQNEIRVCFFREVLKFSQLRMQLIENGFIESLIRDCLTDKKHLSMDFTEKDYELLPVCDLFPIRSEAIVMVLEILLNKDECPELFENLVSMIEVHKIVVNEIKNAQDKNALLRISAIKLIQDLITHAEKEISGMLVQYEAAKCLKAIFEDNPFMREQFQGLDQYLNRYS